MEEALRRFEEIGDRWGISWALRDLGSVALYVGDFPRAQAMLERSLEASRAIGDAYCESLALDYLGQVAYWQRHLDLAASYLEDGLKIGRRLRYGQSISRLEMSLTRVSLATGDVRGAAELLVNSMAQHHTLGQPGGIAEAIERFAEIADAVGEPVLSAQLIGTASAPRETHGAPRQPVGEASHVAFRGRVEAALGSDAWASNLSIGAAMPVEQAVQNAGALARRVTDGEPTTSAQTRTSDTGETQSITPREREVAALVALGLTNRQIAEQIVVSHRTVDAHVASILARLGFSNRAQIAVWAAAQGQEVPSTT
jgi:DNA-binding CsgD family transcriptional regulator